MKIITTIILAAFLMPNILFGQNFEQSIPATTNETASAQATNTQVEYTTTTQSQFVQSSQPIVVPNENPDKKIEITRNYESVHAFNVIGYLVAKAVEMGLPAETIVLTLMIPVLATLMAFIRNIIGLPSLDMLVVIAFSIALLASDILTGALLLAVILFSSIFARALLKKVSIMQLPKISLSMMLVSIFVLVALFIAALSGQVSVASISIVPVLLLIILSERIVRLQFESNPREVWFIVAVSLGIGVIGYYLMLSSFVRSTILNYPEVILLLIPINIFIGKYFGLRLTEYARFGSFIDSVNKKIK